VNFLQKNLISFLNDKKVWLVDSKRL